MKIHVCVTASSLQLEVLETCCEFLCSSLSAAVGIATSGTDVAVAVPHACSCLMD